mmetsp:Transcript_85128/g.226049  ORF Transcript_85128/g.226049 Transcript_85128/m.226049 type:complete len:387 (+) Transcript_85128:250-1410(+)
MQDGNPSNLRCQAVQVERLLALPSPRRLPPVVDGLLEELWHQVVARGVPQQQHAYGTGLRIWQDVPAPHVAEYGNPLLPVHAAHASVERDVVREDVRPDCAGRVCAGASFAQAVEQAKRLVTFVSPRDRVDQRVERYEVPGEAAMPHPAKSLDAPLPMTTWSKCAHQGTGYGGVGLELCPLQPFHQVQRPMPPRVVIAPSHGRAVGDHIRRKATLADLPELHQRALPTCRTDACADRNVVRHEVRLDEALPHQRQRPQGAQPRPLPHVRGYERVEAHHVRLDPAEAHRPQQALRFARPATLLARSDGRGVDPDVRLDVLFQHVVHQVKHEGYTSAMFASTDDSGVGDDIDLYGVQLHVLHQRHGILPPPALLASEHRCIVRDGAHR